MLADRARRVALAAMFAVASVVVGYVYFVTLYMQRVLGFSPLRAGLGLLPATLTVLVTSTWLAAGWRPGSGPAGARRRAGVDRPRPGVADPAVGVRLVPVNVLPGLC